VTNFMSDINVPGMAGLAEGARLLAAACIGILVVAVQRWTRREHPLTRSMEQAHVLLCLAGALTMLIVGDSLPRAFGIAGAAAIVRFRTPVEDPRDITVLFLLMALGMSAGLGLASVAAVGTLFVCACLLLLPHSQSEPPRSMKVALVAEGRQFPTTHVSKVFRTPDRGGATRVLARRSRGRALPRVPGSRDVARRGQRPAARRWNGRHHIGVVGSVEEGSVISWNSSMCTSGADLLGPR